MTSEFPTALDRLSDEQLVAEVSRLVRCERSATAELIAHLAELDTRRLYLGAGYASLFVYCTQALRLSEHEAYNRIEAARAARRFPDVLAMLRDGSANLTTIRLLSPHLTTENCQSLFAAAAGQSRREVEELIARRFPRPPVPSSVRKLPELSSARVARASLAAGDLPSTPPGETESEARTVDPRSATRPAFSTVPTTPPSRRAFVSPLAADQYKVTFTATAETRQKLQRAQDLLRHQVPDGNLPEIFGRALSALLAELESKKLAATRHARLLRTTSADSRHIPAAVRRAVWMRDGGRCAFVAEDGRRCAERGFLEFHHARPYAAGGIASADNIALRCRPHNTYEANLYFDPTRRDSRAETSTRSETSPVAAAGGG